jgi:hypothetical protein
MSIWIKPSDIFSVYQALKLNSQESLSDGIGAEITLTSLKSQKTNFCTKQNSKHQIKVLITTSREEKKG